MDGSLGVWRYSALYSANNTRIVDCGCDVVLNLQFERISTFSRRLLLVRVQQSFDSAALNANLIVFGKI